MTMYSSCEQQEQVENLIKVVHAVIIKHRLFFSPDLPGQLFIRPRIMFLICTFLQAGSFGNRSFLLFEDRNQFSPLLENARKNQGVHLFLTFRRKLYVFFL